MKLALAVAITIGVGCASMTERIVNEALQGLAYEATYSPSDGGNPEALAALYERLTTELRIDVRYLPVDDPILRGAFGISYTTGSDQWFIRVRQDLSVNGTIEVMAHEAAHLFQVPHLTRAEGDVFAEIVSAHVSHALGSPHAVRTSAGWLRQHKPRLRMALDLENEIQHVSRILTPRAYLSPMLVR